MQLTHEIANQLPPEALALLQRAGATVIDAPALDVERATFGPPTAAHLIQINRYRPLGSPAYTEEELLVVPMSITNNLVSRGLARWPAAELARYASLVPGKPHCMDHNFWNADQAPGKWFAAGVVRADQAPEAVMELGGMAPLQQKVIASEGFVQVVGLSFLQAASPAASALRYGRLDACSGSFYCSYQCPLCKTSFRDQSCPHYPPYYYGQAEEDPRFAPFYEFVQVRDLIEVSSVVAGDVPAAGVRKADTGAT